jgi:hypothetical protein
MSNHSQAPTLLYRRRTIDLHAFFAIRRATI